MPNSKLMFFLAWGLIIIVGAYVNFQSPPAERDWYGYGCAMLLIPFAFLFCGVVWAAMKAVLLIPYLLIRGIMDSNAPKRWYSAHWNREGFKSMFIWRDTSCFYIPNTIIHSKDEAEKSITSKRTKEEYENLKRAGKL